MPRCDHNEKYGMMFARNGCIACEAEHQAIMRGKLLLEITEAIRMLPCSNSETPWWQVRQNLIAARKKDKACDSTPEV